MTDNSREERLSLVILINIIFDMTIRAESPDFFILLALLDHPRHGLSVQREVLDLTDGQLHLWPATLYTSLARMARRGWIEELGPQDHPSGESQRRRYFRLSPRGRRVLEERTVSLGKVYTVAVSRLEANPQENG